MLIYIFNIIITVGLALGTIELEKRTNKKSLILIMKILIILIPSLLAGLRYGIGTDFLNVYKPIFESTKLGIYENRGRSIEIGYILINKIVILMNGNLSIVMFLSSLITNAFFVLGIFHYKKKIYVPIAIGIYMLMYYQLSYNLIRQMIAQSIIFFGFRYLDYNEGTKNVLFGIFKYSLCVVIASLFHKSALIMFSIIILNFICRQEKIRFLKYFVYIVALLIIVNCNNISNFMYNTPQLKYYAGYLKLAKHIDISIWYIIKNLPLIIPYLFIKKEIDKDKEFNFLYVVTVIGVILNLLAYLIVDFGERLSLYFSMAQIIIIPAYIETFRKMDKKILKINSKKYFIAANVLFTIFYAVFWTFDFCYKNRNETVPYKSVFQIDKQDTMEK